LWSLPCFSTVGSVEAITISRIGSCEVATHDDHSLARPHEVSFIVYINGIHASSLLALYHREWNGISAQEQPRSRTSACDHEAAVAVVANVGAAGCEECFTFVCLK